MGKGSKRRPENLQKVSDNWDDIDWDDDDLLLNGQKDIEPLLANDWESKEDKIWDSFFN